MTVTHSIDPHLRLVRTQVHGRLTLEDALAHAYTLKTDPLFRPDYSELVDLSGFTGSDLPPEATEAFAKDLPGEVFAPHARRAIVAPADSAFEMSHQYRSMRPNAESFRVFHSMDEAMQWLGVTPNKAMLFE